MISATHSPIDFCICTYNRLDYLKLCLEKLLPAVRNYPVTITVVDNASTDTTRHFMDSVIASHPRVRYLYEPRSGLSHARNTGWKGSASPWVFYLDDDCLPSDDLAEKALYFIQEHPDVAAIGGPIDPLFTTPPPEWLPEGFGRFSMPHTVFTRIESGYIRGGNFLIQRHALETCNGFAEHLGVHGNALRYGEEIDLQRRMRQSGLSIAYAPQLRMAHFVRPGKLTVSWALRSEMARRRDKVLIEPLPLWKASLTLLRVTGGRLVRIPLYLFHLVGSRQYSLKKAMFYFCKPLAYALGEWIGAVRSRQLK